jgi:WD40 repeat protein
VLRGHKDGARSVCFSPDSRLLCTGSGDELVKVWRVTDGKEVASLEGPPRGINAVTWSSDGKHLAATSRPAGQKEPGEVRLWSVTDEKDDKTLFAAGADTGVIGALYGYVDNLGSRWPAELADAGVVRILDARTGKVRRKVRAFRGPLQGLAVTADGRRLFSAGRDGQTGASLIRILDAESGAKRREFKASDVLMEQLAVRPDGKAMATTEVGRRVWLWGSSGNKVQEYVGRSERQSVRTFSLGIG